MNNNLALVISFVASFTDKPVDTDTRLDDAGTDAFDLSLLVGVNTRMNEEAISDDDLETCETVGAFAQLMTEAGYTVTDEELAVNAAADADDDLMLNHLIG